MRVIVLVLALAGAAGSLAACGSGTSDPFDPAIQAMQGVNACGTGGSDNINQCRGHPRSNN